MQHLYNNNNRPACDIEATCGTAPIGGDGAERGDDEIQNRR